MIHTFAFRIADVRLRFLCFNAQQPAINHDLVWWIFAFSFACHHNINGNNHQYAAAAVAIPNTPAVAPAAATPVGDVATTASAYDVVCPSGPVTVPSAFCTYPVGNLGVNAVAAELYAQ